MFLARRTTQAEYFDGERSAAELAAFFQALQRINRLFVFAEPFQRSLPRLLGPSRCEKASILDLGAGDGSLGKVLSEWARQRGWQWRVTNLDLSLAALRLNPAGPNVAGSVLALPFRAGSFDAVIASQMTHHLTDAEVRQHIAEAWRVARHVVMLSDLHRNAALYATLWVVFRLMRFPAVIASDGLLSVERGWRVPELRSLATAAAIDGAEVSLYFGARVLLRARKREALSPLAIVSSSS
ncbi:MAG TPA: methyltransferase domain-containing protein [Candidatus Acidoferrum sp.]|jgi:2-polyprenyl-3-methyl-5-hydroxy-6-metoxy-1,4-benzoquinol methylase|nr:methyltransferase domain-containing protein [Candidatus Acidoferrum sp.]